MATKYISLKQYLPEEFKSDQVLMGYIEELLHHVLIKCEITDDVYDLPEGAEEIIGNMQDQEALYVYWQKFIQNLIGSRSAMDFLIQMLNVNATINEWFQSTSYLNPYQINLNLDFNNSGDVLLLIDLLHYVKNERTFLNLIDINSVCRQMGVYGYSVYSNANYGSPEGIKYHGVYVCYTKLYVLETEPLTNEYQINVGEQTPTGLFEIAAVLLANMDAMFTYELYPYIRPDLNHYGSTLGYGYSNFTYTRDGLTPYAFPNYGPIEYYYGTLQQLEVLYGYMWNSYHRDDSWDYIDGLWEATKDWNTFLSWDELQNENIDDCWSDMKIQQVRIVGQILDHTYWGNDPDNPEAEYSNAFSEAFPHLPYDYNANSKSFDFGHKQISFA